MRWAVFKDFRGVLYCELVNEGMEVWSTLVLGSKEVRNKLTGKVVFPARKEELRTKAVFLESHFSRKNYFNSAFEAPSGYAKDPNRVYLQENYWGPVEVILFVDDDRIGSRLQHLLRQLAPEKGKPISERDPDAVPLPQTRNVFEMIEKIAKTG